MDTISTQTKIETVYGCRGRTMHVMPGTVLLKSKKGYRCPWCGTEVYDISDTMLGREYFMWLRPDKHSPPPLRVRDT